MFQLVFIYDKTLLTNWRPITLLNTDYKILEHILTNRLKKAIPKPINTDQSGYIKGRNGKKVTLISFLVKNYIIN